MDGTIDVTIDQAHKFFADTFLEARGSSPQSSFRRPGVVRSAQLTTSKDDFSIVVSDQDDTERADLRDSLF
jgi:hypothetical protein